MESIDTLPKISIKYLRESLATNGHTLADLETLLQSPGSYVEWVWECRNTYKYSGEVIRTNRAKIEIHRDPERNSLFVEFVYYVQRGDKTGEEQRPRYYLRRVESNLIPGSYRYYFVDPYSDRLCSKLYLFEGRIFPRSVIVDYGLLYKQQREGHKQRYVWTFYHRCPESRDLKYRKSHYRGNITPFWSRYLYLCNEGERRVLGEYLRMGWIDERDLQTLLPDESRERLVETEGDSEVGKYSYNS